MTHAAGRKRVVVGVSAGALLALAAFAPSASAQVGGLTDTVGSTTTSVTETTTAITDAVKAPTGGTIGSTTRKVTELADPVGSTLDETTGTDTYKSTKETLQTTADTADKTIGHIVDPIAHIVEETTGGIGNQPSPDREEPTDGKKGTNPRDTTRVNGPSGGGPSTAAGETRVTSSSRFATLTASERNRGIDRSIATSALAPPQGGSFFRDLAEGAGEAAKRLAFPLALALMVAAFLVVQGRIDRKDAKLALAPIDSEQDLLSFQ